MVVRPNIKNRIDSQTLPHLVERPPLCLYSASKKLNKQRIPSSKGNGPASPDFTDSDVVVHCG